MTAPWAHRLRRLSPLNGTNLRPRLPLLLLKGRSVSYKAELDKCMCPGKSHKGLRGAVEAGGSAHRTLWCPALISRVPWACVEEGHSRTREGASHSLSFTYSGLNSCHTPAPCAPSVRMGCLTAWNVGGGAE